MDKEKMKMKIQLSINLIEAKAEMATYMLSGGMINDGHFTDNILEDYLECYRTNKYTNKGEGFFYDELKNMLWIK